MWEFNILLQKEVLCTYRLLYKHYQLKDDLKSMLTLAIGALQ